LAQVTYSRKVSIMKKRAREQVKEQAVVAAMGASGNEEVDATTAATIARAAAGIAAAVKKCYTIGSVAELTPHVERVGKTVATGGSEKASARHLLTVAAAAAAAAVTDRVSTAGATRTMYLAKSNFNTDNVDSEASNTSAVPPPPMKRPKTMNPLAEAAATAASAAASAAATFAAAIAAASSAPYTDGGTVIVGVPGH
jgi:hypothetical protein